MRHQMGAGRSSPRSSPAVAANGCLWACRSEAAEEMAAIAKAKEILMEGPRRAFGAQRTLSLLKILGGYARLQELENRLESRRLFWIA